ncbi:AAA family ATPase [Micromonospora sp. NPDC004704]
MFIEGMPGSGKSTTLNELSRRVEPGETTGRFFDLSASAAVEAHFRRMVFQHGPNTTLDRVMNLWSWALLAADTYRSTGVGVETVILERSPLSAYAAAAPLISGPTNQSLLDLAMGKIGDCAMVILECPEDMRRRRLSARGARQWWHPTNENASYRGVFADAYARRDSLPCRVVVVDTTVPVAEVASEIMNWVRCADGLAA